MSPRLRALLSWWNLGAVLCAAAVLALFQRCVPLNMDEFVSYQTLACVTHPHAAENVFCSSCASFYLRVLGGFNLPLLTYDYIGSLSSWLYAPLFVLWPSPASARLLGLIALAVQAVILARLFRFRPGAVFCCLLLFFPYSFVHIADTGPVAFQATSVLLVCYLLRRWLLSRRPTRRLGLLAIAGLVIALGCWVKPTYLFVSAGLVTTALLAFGLAWFRRPAERGRRALEYLVLLLCAAVPATLIYHARHPGGGPYLPVFGTSFVPDQIALAGLGARLRDNVLHFVLQPLDVTSMHFDGPVATPVRSVALGLLTLAVIAGAFFTRPAPRRPRAEIAGNLALFGVALLLVATNVYAKSMHHAVLAYPFLLLAAGRSLQLQRHRRWAIAAFSLFVVLQASLFLQLPTLAEEARRHGNPKAFAAELHAELDRRDAADSVIVCVDWGIYFIQSLYGPRSQVVLFLCSPDDDQLEAAAAIAVRLKRDLTLVGLAGNNPIRDRLRPVRSVVERAGPGVGSPLADLATPARRARRLVDLPAFADHSPFICRFVVISVVFLLSVFWLGFVLDERFALSRGDALVRFAAAPILGGFVATWLVYLLAWACGFTPGTILGAVALILAFNLAAARRGCDLAWAASRLTLDRAFWRWAAIFPALVVVSFACGLWRNASGAIVFFGNFTDLSYHMATVSAFIEQDRFPPLNPQSAAAKLSYHFMADFFAAILCRGGLPLYASLKLPMVLWSFSLGTLTCACFASVLRHRVAALCGATLFLFGHIGVFNLVFGLAGHPVGNGPLSWRDPATLLDHLAFPYFNFLNVVIDFFQPQLPFLFGFPLALLVLPALFRHVTENAPPARTTFFIVGLVALLPLFHVHSFLVLAPLAGLVFLADWHATRTTRDTLTRLALLAAAALAVGLQFAFILSQPKVAGFSGFDVGRLLGALAEIPDFLHAKRLWFWVRAAGLPFALGLAAWLRPANFRLRRTDPDRRTNLALLAFFAVTGAYFLTINFYRFTPNWGDSNKFFLYWDLALCLYAARWLATWWTHSRAGRGLVVALLLLGAVGPTAAEWALRLWRGPSILFTRCDQTTAEWIRRNTPRDAVFLTSNSVTHYVTALAGRRVINGAYTRETGFGDDAIEAAVARAYREADPSTLPGLQPDYIVVGPDERNNYRLSRSTLARRHRSVFELNCDDGRYSIYAVRPVSAGQIAQENADREARGYQPLSELDPTFVQQFGILRYDETFSQLPIVLDGKVYPSGLGTHAPSELHFDLDDRYTFFEADIGIDGSQRDGPGSVIFKIGLDDQIVYTSPILYAKSPHEHVRIPLAGAKTLRLIVDDAGDNNHSDHADWADAKLTGPR